MRRSGEVVKAAVRSAVRRAVRWVGVGLALGVRIDWARDAFGDVGLV